MVRQPIGGCKQRECPVVRKAKLQAARAGDGADDGARDRAFYVWVELPFSGAPACAHVCRQDAAAQSEEPSTWAMMILGFAGIGFMA